MTRVLLVRHGHAAASFTEDKDPGLDEAGQLQAEAVAQRLQDELPLKLISSPLKRAQETAAALQAIVGGNVEIESRVSEIPSPGLSTSERGAWLRTMMQGPWQDLSDDLLQWRQDLANCLIQQTENCVIFSHFVAINVTTGYAEGLDDMGVVMADYCSVTEFATDGENLTLVRRADEAVTQVN